VPACLLVAAIGAYATVRQPLLATVAAPAVLLLALGVWRSWTATVPLALALVGAAYAATLVIEDAGVDGGAPLVAAAALLAGELAYWTAAPRAVPAEAGLVRRQAATAALLVLVTVCLGTLLLLVGGASVSGGLPLEALGVAAAAAALAVVARLARST
jgi:hypothetical protein